PRYGRCVHHVLPPGPALQETQRTADPPRRPRFLQKHLPTAPTPEFQQPIAFRNGASPELPLPPRPEGENAEQRVLQTGRTGGKRTVPCRVVIVEQIRPGKAGHAVHDRIASSAERADQL